MEFGTNASFLPEIDLTNFLSLPNFQSRKNRKLEWHLDLRSKDYGVLGLYSKWLVFDGLFYDRHVANANIDGDSSNLFNRLFL